MALLDKEKQKKAGELATKYSREFSALSKTAKAMAEARRNISPVSVEKTLELIGNLSEYEQEQIENDKPLTIGGYILASGLKRDTFYRVVNGNYDYVVDEYRLLHDIPQDKTSVIVNGEEIPLIPWSEIFEKCYIKIQEQLEQNLYNVKARNASGSIFALKARYDWKEDNSPNSVKNVNNLVIADSEQALKALKALE